MFNVSVVQIEMFKQIPLIPDRSINSVGNQTPCKNKAIFTTYTFNFQL